jgi:hypothetical protein
MENLSNCYHSIEVHHELTETLKLKPENFTFSEIIENAKSQVVGLKNIIVETQSLIDRNKEVKKEFLSLIKQLKSAIDDIELQNDVGKTNIRYYENVIEHLADCCYPTKIN